MGNLPWHAPSAASSAPHLVQPTLADAREVSYTCLAGHVRVVRLAAEALVPPEWDCRVCGQTAILTDDAGGELDPLWRPSARETAGSKTHWQHVLERRSIPELEAILAERLEWLRARRGGPASLRAVPEPRRAAS